MTIEQIKKRIETLREIKYPYYKYAIEDNFNNTSGCEYFGILNYLDKEIQFSEHLLKVLLNEIN